MYVVDISTAFNNAYPRRKTPFIFNTFFGHVLPPPLRLLAVCGSIIKELRNVKSEFEKLEF